MKLVFVILIGSMIVLSGFSAGNNEPEDSSSQNGSGSGSMATTTDDMDQEMTKTGVISFTTLEDARLIAEKGPAVLFFNANWCPTCRAALAEIETRIDELGDITVILVNYDRERELKKRYSVTYQHTYVQIDPEGEIVSHWNGGGVDEILENVKRMEVS